MGLGLASTQVFSDVNFEYLRWKKFRVQYFNDSATANLIGLGTAITNTGTQAGVTQTTTILNGSKYTTGAVSGNSAGVLADAIHSRGHYIRIAFQVTLVTVTSIRVAVGLGAATVAQMVASAAPVQNYFGFRFDTGASDANWQCVSDNASGTPTVLNSNVAATATTYLLQLLVDPIGNRINYFINGLFVGANSTTLPATSVVTLAAYSGLATLTNGAANMNTHFINGRSRVGNI